MTFQPHETDRFVLDFHFCLHCIQLTLGWWGFVLTYHPKK